MRRKALLAGAEAWLAELPALVAALESEWSFVVGEPFAGGTEAFVAAATLDDGSDAVLKLLIPRGGETLDSVRNEITTLRLANGEGCARLLRGDVGRSALLLERLGTPMFELGLPLEQRHEHLCAAARRVWRPAPDCGLPTGAEKAHWLAGSIVSMWEDLDHPCSERAVDHALSCAVRRISAHDDERTGLDATAIWEWGAIERVSTGLLATQLDMQPEARQMLAVADRVSAD